MDHAEEPRPHIARRPACGAWICAPVFFFGLADTAQGQTVDASLPLALSVNEVVAMGGAGIGFAHGAAGLLYNPAAPAVRRLESRQRLDGTATLTGSRARPGEANDLSNVGTRYADAGEWLLNMGATGSLGRWGAGPALTALQIDQQDSRARVVDGHLAAAMTFRDGQHAVGLGSRLVGVELAQGDAPVERFLGAGIEGGLALSSDGGAWNLGLAARSPVRAAPADGQTRLGMSAVAVPGQVGIGVGWCAPAIRSPLAPGPRARLAGDLVVYGRVPGGVALTPLLSGEQVPRGRTPSLSPRLGAEVEVWPERLKLRAGTYLEPSRSPDRPARTHATGGLEVRVVHLRALWGLLDHDLTWEGSIDHAENYTRLAWLGVGIWHGGQVGGRNSTPP